MPVYFDNSKNRWRYQFYATIEGKTYRGSKLLPPGYSEAQASSYEQRETAKRYAKISKGTGHRAPLILDAVATYVEERLPNQADWKNSLRNLEYLEPYCAGHRLDKLGAISRKYSADHIHLANATVHQRLATLRAAVRYALKYHRMGSGDFILEMTLPAVDNDREVFLDRRELLTLARAITHRATRALVLMVFATGARPGELHRSLPGNGYFRMKDKKGDTIRKPVPARFQRYMRFWPMPLDYTRYSFYFREGRRLVGMDHVHLHDLRHSTASAIIDLGGSLAQVGEVLDHKSHQSSARYAHLATKSKARILESIFDNKPFSTHPAKKSVAVKRK